MHARNVYSNITPLPLSVSREAVVAFLHDHGRMLLLNPLKASHEQCPPPTYATLEEVTSCTWYSVTDKLSWVPGTPATTVTYKIGLYRRPDGMQTHFHAPNGVDIRGYWKIGGNLPGEPRQAVEPGLKVPEDRLYLRENVDLKCSILLLPFVKRNIKKFHFNLVASLIAKVVEEAERAALLKRAYAEGQLDSSTSMVSPEDMSIAPCPETTLNSNGEKRRTPDFFPTGDNDVPSPPPYSLVHPAFRHTISTPTRTRPNHRHDELRAVQRINSLAPVSLRETPPRETDNSSPSEAACMRGEHGPGCPHYFIATYGSIDWEPLESITPAEERHSPYELPHNPWDKPLPPIHSQDSPSASCAIYTPENSPIYSCAGVFHNPTCMSETCDPQLAKRPGTSAGVARTSQDSAVFLLPPTPPRIPRKSPLRPPFDPSIYDLKPRPLNIRRSWSVTLPPTLRPRSPILRLVIPS